MSPWHAEPIRSASTRRGVRPSATTSSAPACRSRRPNGGATPGRSRRLAQAYRETNGATGTQARRGSPRSGRLGARAGPNDRGHGGSRWPGDGSPGKDALPLPLRLRPGAAGPCGRSFPGSRRDPSPQTLVTLEGPSRVAGGTDGRMQAVFRSLAAPAARLRGQPDMTPRVSPAIWWL